MSRNRLLTAADVAEQLSVSETTARRIMRQVGTVRLGSGPGCAVRVRQEALEKWLGGREEAPVSVVGVADVAVPEVSPKPATGTSGRAAELAQRLREAVASSAPRKTPLRVIEGGR